MWLLHLYVESTVWGWMDFHKPPFQINKVIPPLSSLLGCTIMYIALRGLHHQMTLLTIKDSAHVKESVSSAIIVTSLVTPKNYESARCS